MTAASVICSSVLLAVASAGGSSEYERACGTYVPGAGIDKFTPFQKVQKDGFMFVDCLKDYMWSHGDKFGARNKEHYALGAVSGVSIVHYEAHVAKDQQKKMSPEVCFKFCRTVPNMGFFGLKNGNKCYCTPYYKMETEGSDDSQCDDMCEGEATSVCGGHVKSSLYSMHMCDDTKDELIALADTASKSKKSIDGEAQKAAFLAKSLQHNGEELQAIFGAVGDKDATDLAQKAKVFGGKLGQAAQAGKKASSAFGTVLPAAAAVAKATRIDVNKAEGIMKSLQGMVKTAAPVDEQLKKLVGLGSFSEKGAKGAMSQYNPIGAKAGTKGSLKTGSTCNGQLVGEPMLAKSKDECAKSCDSHVSVCQGFQYFESPSKTCFLFSKIKTARQYTGCKGKAFLQVSDAPFETTCYVKFADFTKSSVKITKANRCYGAAKAMAAKAKAAKKEYKEAKKDVMKAQAALKRASKIAAQKKKSMKKSLKKAGPLTLD